MPESTITTKGQTTVPQPIREAPCGIQSAWRQIVGFG